DQRCPASVHLWPDRLVANQTARSPPRGVAMTRVFYLRPATPLCLQGTAHCGSPILLLAAVRSLGASLRDCEALLPVICPERRSRLRTAACPAAGQFRAAAT